MFTFGREHERQCAIRLLRRTDDIELITQVVDAVHDVIERKADPSSIRTVLVRALSTGRSGVWEQTGSWLLKLGKEFPDLQSTWVELAGSTDGNVRFRVACLLDDLPIAIAGTLGEQLKADRHKKTREMAIDRLENAGVVIRQSPKRG